MTRIEIVTQLVAAQIMAHPTWLCNVSKDEVEEAERIADIILSRQAAWYEINKPKTTGRMG